MHTLQDLAQVMSAAYVVAFIVACALVLWLARPVRWKVAGVVALSVAFAYPIVTRYLQDQEMREKNRVLGERFAKLCKEKAGDRIVRTVEGVEGFFLMRPRKPTTDKEYADQYWMGDPYGHSPAEAENPANAFLSDRPKYESQGKTLISAIAGYEYIELPNPDRELNPNAPKYLRITAARRWMDGGTRMIDYDRTPTDTLRSRYGVDWEDISTPEDRKVWTAGGRMRVIDLQSKEVIAERTGYVIDPMQVHRAGTFGWSAWGEAQKSACPPFESSLHKTKEFVARVLKPLRSM